MGDVVNSKKGDNYSWGKCMTSPCENTQPFISVFQLFLLTCFEFCGSGPFPVHSGLAHLIVDIKGFSRMNKFEENSKCVGRFLYRHFKGPLPE